MGEFVSIAMYNGKFSTPTLTGTFYIEGIKTYFGTDKYRVQ